MKRLLNWLGDHPYVVAALAVGALAVGAILKIASFSTEGGSELELGRLGLGIKVVHTPKQLRTLEREAARKGRAARRAERRNEQQDRSERLNDDGSIDSGEYDDFTGKDKELAKAMDAAFWDNDMKGAIALASSAIGSANPKLREKAVERLAWYDVDGMAALTPFMTDPDENVAQTAIAAWTDALAHVDDDNERADIVRLMAKSMNSAEAINNMLIATGNTSDLATMQIIVDVIDTGTEEAMAAAKDHYEFMTGEEFTTIEAAEEWLRTESDMVAEIDTDDEGDVEAISKAAGMSVDQYWERLEQQAKEANMDLEAYVEALRREATDNGQSLTDYLVEREGNLSGKNEGNLEVIGRAVGMTADEYRERLEQQAADANMNMDEFIEALRDEAKEARLTLTDYIIEKEKEIAAERNAAGEQAESEE